MKKNMFLFLSLLLVTLLSACNLGDLSQNSKDNGQGKEQKKEKLVQTNQQTLTGKSEQIKTEQVKTEQVKAKPDITIYIDKNCEQASVPQCSSNFWKQQLSGLAGTGLKIKYFDQKTIEKLKNINIVSPVMELPENNLYLFGKEANLIKQQAKKSDGKYYISLYNWIAGEENLCYDGKDNNNDGKIDAQDPTCFKMDVLVSNKCTEQYCNVNFLKTIFGGYVINPIDIHTEEGKKIYNKLKQLNQKQYLPTFLFNKQKPYMEQMKAFIKEHKQGCKYKYQLDLPQFKYDPDIEACATNCNALDACKKLLSCNKTDKPKVELFVMSYCPFGTQAEKGILGAVNTLKGKIDFKVKFVNYVMHGKKEIDENNLQYCIQEKEPNKYNTYLTCFLQAGNSKDCLKKANIDMNKINACIEEVKQKFNTEKNYNDRSTWLNGRFPKYDIYDELNKKYNVQGSPTLVINGIKVQPRNRSPQAYLEIICKAFKNPPAECKKVLSNQVYDPMWGWTQNGKAAPAGSCGN